MRKLPLAPDPVFNDKHQEFSFQLFKQIRVSMQLRNINNTSPALDLCSVCHKNPAVSSGIEKYFVSGINLGKAVFNWSKSATDVYEIDPRSPRF